MTQMKWQWCNASFFYWQPSCCNICCAHSHCGCCTYVKGDCAAVSTAIQCPAKLYAQLHIHRWKVAVHDLRPQLH